MLKKQVVLTGLVASCGLSLLAMSASAATTYGASPYLCFDAATTAATGTCTADSPFAAVDFSGGYFHLENFEDGLLNTPGATTQTGGLATPSTGITDSVDEDDGAIDGSGLQGNSWFSSSGGTGLYFYFDAAILGQLPTYAGLVWTDGAITNDVTFQAYGASDNLLAQIAGTGIGDSSFGGGTAEDRFFGAYDASGIAYIRIWNSAMSGGGSGIEVDHLQYGRQGTNTSVPEPGTLALLGLGLAGLGLSRRRKA